MHRLLQSVSDVAMMPYLFGLSSEGLNDVIIYAHFPRRMRERGEATCMFKVSMNAAVPLPGYMR